MEKQEVSNYLWHYPCRFVAFFILLWTRTVHSKVSFIIYLRLTTFPYCFAVRFVVTFVKGSQKHSSFWKWFVATIQDHISILFNFLQSCMTYVNTNLYKYKTVLIIQKTWYKNTESCHVNLQLSQKLQLPDWATRILKLIAWIKFLVNF